MTALKLFVLFLVLPLMATLWLARAPRTQPVVWWAAFLFATAFVAQSVIIAPWGWLSIAWRYVLVIVYIAALLFSLMRRGVPPVAFPRSVIIIELVLAFVFGALAVLGLLGWIPPDDVIALDFPFADGAYIVAQGGGSVVINYHHVYAPQRYALDIVRLNRFGMRASGFYPSDLTKYAIFGTEIHSPCDGFVVEARDGVPDLAPPNRTPSLPEGNYVKLNCGGTFVILAHMRRGTVRVGVGDVVSRHDILGNVGNSGNTTEPHLHIHAERDGRGVGILLLGRWPVRNRVFVPSAAD